MYEYPVTSTATNLLETQGTPTPPPVYGGMFPPPPLPRARRGIPLSALIVIAVVLIVALVVGLPLALVRAQAIAYPSPNVAILISTGGTTTALTGKPVQFSVRVNSGHKLTYTWSFGDGASATGAQVAHSFHDFGQYEVALTATDPVGQSTNTQTLVHVKPGPPTAAFSITASLNDPFHINFDGRASTGLSIQYHWDFGDGASDTTSGAQASHEYSSNTTYTATLSVIDPTNQTATITHQVTIVIAPPHASFTASISSSNPYHVSVDASSSTGYKLHYQWDFGDGQSSQSGPRTTHDYGSLGTFVISLSVTDQIGQQNQMSRQVTITIPPPQAAFQVNGTSDPATFNFDGSFSSGYGLSYSWSFGDGNGGGGSQAQHTYSSDGTYNVSLTVTDSAGQTSYSSQSVTVFVPTPYASFGTNQAGDPAVFAFDASSSYGHGLSYSWDFGDGNSGSGINPTHQYQANGTYTVTLTVTDEIGQTSQAQTSVTISVPAPTATFTWSNDPNNADQIDFNASGSSGDNLQWYCWFYGDPNNTYQCFYGNPYTSFVYPSGRYTVTLQLHDEVGQVSQYQLTVTAP